jgi:hypothetical protein
MGFTQQWAAFAKQISQDKARMLRNRKRQGKAAAAAGVGVEFAEQPHGDDGLLTPRLYSISPKGSVESTDCPPTKAASLEAIEAWARKASAQG